MEKIRTIRLYGKLGTQFGRVHRFVVNDTLEAIRALCTMVPGFERELMNSADHGIGYACFIGKRNIGQEQLAYPVGGEDIRITPIIIGSKQAGLTQIIVGVVLIVAAYFTGGATLAGMVGPGSGAAGVMTGAGVAMVAGGVVAMLSPQQAGLAAKDGPNNGASYNFNGAVNTQAQGSPEPLLYGETITGSVVISAGIYAEDQQ